MTVYYGSAVAVCWQSVGQVWTVRLPADGPHRLSTVCVLSNGGSVQSMYQSVCYSCLCCCWAFSVKLRPNVKTSIKCPLYLTFFFLLHLNLCVFTHLPCLVKSPVAPDHVLTHWFTSHHSQCSSTLSYTLLGFSRTTLNHICVG